MICDNEGCFFTFLRLDLVKTMSKQSLKKLFFLLSLFETLLHPFIETKTSTISPQSELSFDPLGI